jgi:hypothetical protein
MKLANDCQKFKKAFSNSTFGKVLVIFFDTSKLAWRLPDDKMEKILGLIAFVKKMLSASWKCRNY